jgi:hypothetical protein
MRPAIDHLELRTLLSTGLDQIHLPVRLAHDIVTLEAGQVHGRNLAHVLAAGKGKHHDHILDTTSEMELARHVD